MAAPRRLSYVVNQDIDQNVILERLDETLVPPAKVPVDITGWAARWVLIDTDGTTVIWSVLGVITGPGTDGTFKFTIPGATNATEGELLASQIKVYTDGVTSNPPDILIDLQVTIRNELPNV